jgi:hypothetical protein
VFLCLVCVLCARCPPTDILCARVGRRVRRTLPGQYVLTPVGDRLRAGDPESMRDFFRAETDTVMEMLVPEDNAPGSCS